MPGSFTNGLIESLTVNVKLWGGECMYAWEFTNGLIESLPVNVKLWGE